MTDKKTPPPRRVHFVNTITLVKKEKESRDTTPREYEGLTNEVDDEVGSNELEEQEDADLEYFNTFPSIKELEYHECGLHETQCFMENHEQAFVDYASSHDKEVEGKQFTTNQGPKKFNESTNAWKDSEMDDLTSEGHDLLSSTVILCEGDYRRGCERASELESGFYMDVDKLDPSYKEKTNRINLDGSFEVGRSRRSEVNDKVGAT
nr:hypothetical protein [Tanacetum cinerariifolium]